MGVYLYCQTLDLSNYAYSSLKRMSEQRKDTETGVFVLWVRVFNCTLFRLKFLGSCTSKERVVTLLRTCDLRVKTNL